MSEDQRRANGIAALEKWFATPRYAFTERPYTAAQVQALRGSIVNPPTSGFTATKLYNICRSKFQKGEYAHTFGALDPVQVVQMAPHLECVYVSGWQCSSTASSSNEPGPDFADYPANTVPNKVDQLFKAQLFHDRRQNEERSRMSPEERAKTPFIDYLRPIIADGDTGFGGMTSVMKMVKMQIESGAAGVHIEDQKPGAKKCGHMGGKVLVPMREQVDRMVAARLMADILGTETVFIARTDACSATFIENTIDARDHPFIAGCTNPDIGTLEDAKDQEAWLEAAQCCRYTEAVSRALKAAGKGNLVAQWEVDSMKMSNPQARAAAQKLGVNPFFDWEACRAREGYYRVIGGIDYSIQRAIAFSPVSDLIWMETDTPNVADCKEFSDGVHAVRPNQMLAYNLSPSFNWDAAGMNDDDIQAFQGQIGKLGFTWHFITLCGFHSNALMIDQIAEAYAGPKGVLAYVQMIQREERRLNVSTLTHQKWSGAELCDQMLSVATGGGASTASLKGATEAQFKAKL